MPRKGEFKEFCLRGHLKTRHGHNVSCAECSRERFGSSYVCERLQRLKDAVIAGYGGKCTCCGESHREFLTLEHVLGDGAIKREGGNNVSEWRRALRDEFPVDLTILCWNCNCARAYYGRCPHGR